MTLKNLLSNSYAYGIVALQQLILISRKHQSFSVMKISAHSETKSTEKGQMRNKQHNNENEKVNSQTHKHERPSHPKPSDSPNEDGDPSVTTKTLLKGFLIAKVKMSKLIPNITLWNQTQLLTFKVHNHFVATFVGKSLLKKDFLHT